MECLLFPSQSGTRFVHIAACENVTRSNHIQTHAIIIMIVSCTSIYNPIQAPTVLFSYFSACPN
jgi:hypothetical protein